MAGCGSSGGSVPPSTGWLGRPGCHQHAPNNWSTPPAVPRSCRSRSLRLLPASCPSIKSLLLPGTRRRTMTPRSANWPTRRRSPSYGPRCRATSTTSTRNPIRHRETRSSVTVAIISVPGLMTTVAMGCMSAPPPIKVQSSNRPSGRLATLCFVPGIPMSPGSTRSSRSANAPWTRSAPRRVVTAIASIST